MDIIITAGSGPKECAFAVALVSRKFEAEARDFGLKISVKDRSPVDSESEAFRSIVYSIQGKQLDSFLVQWIGTIQWIGQSPYRPFHKRKNWFLGIERLEDVSLLDSNGKIEVTTMRATGPGGQNVNKTNSAVRAVHIETGIAVSAREERSQVQNRKRAARKIRQHLDERNKASLQKAENEKWSNHWAVERGQPTRIFRGLELKE